MYALLLRIIVSIYPKFPASPIPNHSIHRGRGSVPFWSKQSRHAGLAANLHDKSPDRAFLQRMFLSRRAYSLDIRGKDLC
jgi:hypothetical protein